MAELTIRWPQSLNSLELLSMICAVVNRISNKQPQTIKTLLLVWVKSLFMLHFYFSHRLTLPSKSLRERNYFFLSGCNSLSLWCWPLSQWASKKFSWPSAPSLPLYDVDVPHDKGYQHLDRGLLLGNILFLASYFTWKYSWLAMLW